MAAITDSPSICSGTDAFRPARNFAGVRSSNDNHRLNKMGVTCYEQDEIECFNPTCKLMWCVLRDKRLKEEEAQRKVVPIKGDRRK